MLIYLHSVSAAMTGLEKDPAEVRAFPHSDDDFVRLVHATMSRMAPCDASALEDALRTHYPSIRIVPQSPLGAIGDSIVWYAYRDGVAVPRERDHGVDPGALEREAS